MAANTKTSIAALALVLLGMLVLIAGEKSLILMIPAAALVWYGAAPRLRSGRN
jgi:p-aminobenzoyl-glutamate transporter AbgT